MTTSEFSNEFDILYNNISNNAAPGVSEYEKSVFLTMAQEQVIKDVYSQYEINEAVRQYLQPLIKHQRITRNDNTPILGESCYEVPKDLMFVLNMYVTVPKFVEGITEQYKKRVDVVPQDQYLKSFENPFKNNTYNKCISVTVNGNFELSVASNFLDVIYLKKPSPIILENLEGVTICSESKITECELPESLHYEILKKAVQIALVTNGVTSE